MVAISALYNVVFKVVKLGRMEDRASHRSIHSLRTLIGPWQRIFNFHIIYIHAYLAAPLKKPIGELHLFTKRHEAGTCGLKCPIKAKVFFQGNVVKGRPHDKIFLKLQLREAESFQKIQPPERRWRSVTPTHSFLLKLRKQNRLAEPAAFFFK